MSVGYAAIQWSPHIRRYDLAIAAVVVGFLALFVAIGKLVWRGEHAVSDPILVIRALGTCAYLLLHIILCIGPLARLHPIFLPLLFNRRHLGVATFMIALLHALLVVGWYHGFGVISPIRSLLISNTSFDSLTAFPFELLGLIALVILFLMAATSHDFWIKNLSPAFWKRLHMLVYPAWALLVLHVALGALQSERAVIHVVLVSLGVLFVCGLHLLTGRRENRAARPGSSDDSHPAQADERWIDVASVDQIPVDRALVVRIPGKERLAVFRHGDKLSAVTNVCAHQAGPLGEGRIIDGCITCPWHGYQYRPADGCAPPPFTERIRTYRITVSAHRVLIDPTPLPPGSYVEPACIDRNPCSNQEPSHDSATRHGAAAIRE